MTTAKLKTTALAKKAPAGVVWPLWREIKSPNRRSTSATSLTICTFTPIRHRILGYLLRAPNSTWLRGLDGRLTSGSYRLVLCISRGRPVPMPGAHLVNPADFDKPVLVALHHSHHFIATMALVTAAAH